MIMSCLKSASFAVGVFAASVGFAEEVELRAVTGLPVNNPLNARMASFVELVNERGAGVVQINLVGGPEVVPPQQQDTAIRNGVIDLLAAPSSYYAGSVPEGNAVKGSNLSPAELRENGGYELLETIWREKLNAVMLGNVASDISFHLYLVDEPKFTDDGRLDLSGVSMRSTPAYNSWLDALGASSVVLQASEIFSALERGIVGGFAWPALGATSLGVQDFVKYRIDPGVWQVDTLIVVNQDKWNSLSEEAQNILRDALATIEDGNKAFFAEMQQTEDAVFQQAGTTLLKLEGDRLARHLEIADGVVWQELREQAPENYEALRALLYKE